MTPARPRVELPVDRRSPIFIGGQRRSGTTLLRVLLNRHPRVACGPESKFVQHPSFASWHERLASQWMGRVERSGFDEGAVDRAMAALVDHVFSTYARAQHKPRWAEKTPSNILHIDYLFRLFPHAQFVHVVRDPRDTFCSIRQRAATDKPHWARFTAKRSALDWRESILAGKRWRDRPERYVELRYERLVSDARGVMHELLDFLGEPWDERVFDPAADNAEARTANIRHSTIAGGSVGRWRRELNGHDLRKIQAIAGDLMLELGYEPA